MAEGDKVRELEGESSVVLAMVLLDRVKVPTIPAKVMGFTLVFEEPVGTSPLLSEGDGSRGVAAGEAPLMSFFEPVLGAKEETN